MTIIINSKLKIKRLDEFNVTYQTLKSVNTKDGNKVEKWVDNGFFNTPEMAIKKALQSEIKRRTTKDFKSIEEYIKYENAVLTKLVEELMK